MSQPSGVVILCEDTQTACFIRMFLHRRLGWRTTRSEISPKGAGSGEQAVRNRFAKELKAYRSRSNRARTCLIVAIDADTLAVSQRLRQFEEACAAENIPFRRDGEQVAFIIPKRNIETWFAYLREEAVVNEDQPYPPYDNPSDCRGDVVKLDRMCAQQRLAPNPPPSLKYACEEFNRII